MPPTIEEASPKYLDELFKIEKRCFRKEAFSKPQIARLLTNCNCIGLVARDCSEIIGFCIAAISHKRDAVIGHILTIDVLPEHRNKGIGARLLKEIERILKEKGAKTCQLEVREDNEGAVGLYKRMGYKEVRRLKNYYENMHGIRMERSLT